MEKGYILLSNGKNFDFNEPDSSEFGIEEIAHALSHLCRFSGHCSTFYSVAQHSLWVSHLVSPDNALAGLLHDAAEAFLGDLTRPLKRMLPDYQKLEKRIEQVVFKRFSLPPELPDEVKRADLIMLATEARDLMPTHPDVWSALKGIEPMGVKLIPTSAEQSRHNFLYRYRVLMVRKSL